MTCTHTCLPTCIHYAPFAPIPCTASVSFSSANVNVDTDTNGDADANVDMNTIQSTAPTENEYHRRSKYTSCENAFSYDKLKLETNKPKKHT